MLVLLWEPQATGGGGGGMCRPPHPKIDPQLVTTLDRAFFLLRRQAESGGGGGGTKLWHRSIGAAVHLPKTALGSSHFIHNDLVFTVKCNRICINAG